ncbi:MAG: 30S ribosomal protein S6 [Candidatus Kapaibacterium sp.]|jgi:small subunit ribosomal protein S6
MSLRRVYETTIIINAALEDPDIDAVITKITNYLENHGGEIEEKNKWGRRRLAYPINKKYNGYYVHLIFNSVPSILPSLERFLTLEDTILRHLTLQLSSALREYRRERSLAEGKSGETTISSASDDTSGGSRFNKKATEYDIDDDLEDDDDETTYDDEDTTKSTVKEEVENSDANQEVEEEK